MNINFLHNKKTNKQSLGFPGPFHLWNLFSSIALYIAGSPSFGYNRTASGRPRPACQPSLLEPRLCLPTHRFSGSIDLSLLIGRKRVPSFHSLAPSYAMGYQQSMRRQMALSKKMRRQMAHINIRGAFPCNGGSIGDCWGSSFPRGSGQDWQTRIPPSTAPTSASADCLAH
jgi:hypothetical protein